MGMGNYANSAYVVDENFVRDNAKKELDALINLLEENGMSLFDFMVGISDDIPINEMNNGIDDVDITDKVDKCWLDLKETFTKNTGLELYIVYHEKDDRGDDIDGAVWCVDGVMDYTPAGKKYKDKITYSTWTVFG